MNYETYFEAMFESIPDHRKIRLLLYLIKNDVDLLNECGYFKNVIICLNLEFKNIFLEQNEEYLDYIKNEEKSITEKILNN